MFRQFVRDCREEHGRLSRLLAKWAAGRRAGVLPLAPAPDRPFDLADRLVDLRAAFPGAYTPFVPKPAAAGRGTDGGKSGDGGGAAATAAAAGVHPAEAARRRLVGNVDRLGLEIVGMHGDLLEQLADLAVDCHLSRALLVADDTFHVSAVSVMGVVAAANLAHECAVATGQAPAARAAAAPPTAAEARPGGRSVFAERPIVVAADDPFPVGAAATGVGGTGVGGTAAVVAEDEPALARTIVLPLEVVARHSGAFRNGDLLVWDLLARSAYAAWAGGRFGPDATDRLGRYVGAFVGHSTLAKLDLAFEVPADVLTTVEANHWPGLEALVADDGAASIRRSAVGRLARHCGANPLRGVAVTHRWLTALAGLGRRGRRPVAAGGGDENGGGEDGRRDERLKLAATLLAARFFWELLDQRQSVLPSMAGRGGVSLPLLRAVDRFERRRREPRPPEPELADLHRGLCDVANCLDNYEAYRAVRDAARTAAQTAAPAGRKAGA